MVEVHGHFAGGQDNGRLVTEELTAAGYDVRVVWSNSAGYFYLRGDPRPAPASQPA